MAAVDSARPRRSTGGVAGSRDSGTKRHVSTMANAATGAM
jgi:hypothetical protein